MVANPTGNDWVFWGRAGTPEGDVPQPDLGNPDRGAPNPGNPLPPPGRPPDLPGRPPQNPNPQPAEFKTFEDFAQFVQRFPQGHDFKPSDFTGGGFTQQLRDNLGLNPARAAALAQQLQQQQLQGTGDTGLFANWTSPAGAQIGTGIGQLAGGGWQVANGQLVDGAGNVVHGAGNVVGGVLDTAGNLVGVQVDGGSVVMFDGRVLQAPSGGAEGGTLLYTAKGELLPAGSPAGTGAGTRGGPQSPLGDITHRGELGENRGLASGSNPGNHLGWERGVGNQRGASSESFLARLGYNPQQTLPGTLPSSIGATGATGTAAQGAGATAAAASTAAATTASAAAASGLVAAPPGPQVSTPAPPGFVPTPGNQGKGNAYGHGKREFGQGVLDFARVFLAEVLGGKVSRQQAAAFLSALSPRELVAFLADPAKTLPSVMSALLSIATRGQGKGGQHGKDALVMLFDRFVARHPTVDQVRAFFESLNVAQVKHLIAHRAEAIGNLPGVPHEVRYAANSLMMSAELNRLRSSPADARRAATLDGLLATKGQFLAFDPRPGGQMALGTVSQTFGNLAESQYTAVMHFGSGNSMDTFPGLAQRAQLVHEMAQTMAPQGVSILAHLGRLSPALLAQYKAMMAGWQSRGETQVRAEFQLALQRAAHQMTQNLLPSLMLKSGARLSLVGHSYGSAVIKESLKEGAKADACIFLGLPARRLRKVLRQPGCSETDLYALLVHGDEVDELAVPGDEQKPAAAEASKEADAAIAWLDPGEDSPTVEATLDRHHDYLLEGSQSLTQVVNVIVGRSIKSLPAAPEVLTLYPSDSGMFEERPVRRAPAGEGRLAERDLPR